VAGFFVSSSGIAFLLTADGRGVACFPAAFAGAFMFSGACGCTAGVAGGEAGSDIVGEGSRHRSAGPQASPDRREGQGHAAPLDNQKDHGNERDDMDEE